MMWSQIRADIGSTCGRKPRYQENALDIDEAGEAHRAKFVVGARLRYLGPSDDNPPTGLESGDLVTVAERNDGLQPLGVTGGHGIAVIGPRGGVDMVWWYEVELVNTAGAAGV